MAGVRQVSWLWGSGKGGGTRESSHLAELSGSDWGLEGLDFVGRWLEKRKLPRGDPNICVGVYLRSEGQAWAGHMQAEVLGGVARGRGSMKKVGDAELSPISGWGGLVGQCGR